MSNKNRSLNCKNGVNRFNIKAPDGEALGQILIYVESNRVVIELDRETRDRKSSRTDHIVFRRPEA